ncbi:MAG TPA: hypothetical protein VGL91_10495 [Acidobacteriota bacterium]
MRRQIQRLLSSQWRLQLRDRRTRRREGGGNSADGRKQEAGSRRQEADSRRQEAGGRKQTADSRRQEADGRKQTAGGSRNSVIRHLSFVIVIRIWLLQDRTAEEDR